MLLQVVVVIIPQVANIFKLTPLTGEQWLYTALISLAPLVIVEIQKKFNEFKFGKTIYQKESIRESIVAKTK